MKISFGKIMTGEFSRFQSDAVLSFEEILAEGLFEFKTEMIEKVYVRFVCVSHEFRQFFKASRPKYYADKIVKIPGSVTPEVRMYKCLTFDFFLDFDTYFHAKDEECLSVLGRAFMDTLETLKYPGALKKFDREAFNRAVRKVLVDHGILSKYTSPV